MGDVSLKTKIHQNLLSSQTAQLIYIVRKILLVNDS
jgi:hypothetical protein